MARRWAGGGSTLKEDAAAFGLVIEGADEEDEEIEIWPENLEIVDAFLACQTQWSVSELSGRYTGLRYADVAAALDSRRRPGGTGSHQRGGRRMVMR